MMMGVLGLLVVVVCRAVGAGCGAGHLPLSTHAKALAILSVSPIGVTGCASAIAYESFVMHATTVVALNVTQTPIIDRSHSRFLLFSLLSPHGSCSPL